MNVVVLDLETFYSDDYTLKKLSTEEYIRDPRFEAHGAAIKWTANTSAQWYDERQLRHILKEHDWDDTLLISHHAQFDHLILSHHYDVRPKMSGCTLSMARLLLGNHLSVSLDAVRKHFNIPLKTTPYNLFRGKHWSEMDVVTQRLVAEGCCDETESIWTIFGLLYRQFPPEELSVIDTTIKMFAQPVLRADSDMLSNVWMAENTRKKQRLAELGVTEADLQSADRFAELLRQEGVEPELKQGKKKSIYCFAKTDQFMRDLLEDDNERLRTLAETRLGVKSTILQTRAETLGWMARRGPLCVYLNYSGAGTLRVSGGDGTNWLNFKRGSDIRKSILAPEGYLLAPLDASQIECRVLHYLAGGPDEPVIQKFRNHEDPYVDLASRFYGEQIYKPAKDDPRRAEMEAKRGMGKQGRLMAGYGCAGAKFKATAKAGLYGPSVEISIEDATNFVKMYRETNPLICDWDEGYWAQAEQTLGTLARGEEKTWGPLHIKNKRIYIQGVPMNYDTLEWHIPAFDEEVRNERQRKGYWRMKTRAGWKEMWGSKLTQNVCEGVSRMIVSQAMNRITAMGYRVLNWPYDELLLLIPDDGHAEQHLDRCRQEMIRDVTWLPGLPLDAEGNLGMRYSK